MNVRIWFRGRLVTLEGWIEPPDRTVGIYGPVFCLENLIAEDEYGPFILDVDSLSDGEMRDIDRAFWASQPIDDFEVTQCHGSADDEHWSLPS